MSRNKAQAAPTSAPTVTASSVTAEAIAQATNATETMTQAAPAAPAAPAPTLSERQEIALNLGLDLMKQIQRGENARRNVNKAMRAACYKPAKDIDAKYLDHDNDDEENPLGAWSEEQIKQATKDGILYKETLKLVALAWTLKQALRKAGLSWR